MIDAAGDDAVGQTLRRPRGLPGAPALLVRARGDMHRLFQQFIDRINAAAREEELRDSLSDLASAYDVPCFAYYAFPAPNRTQTRIISTYTAQWAAHYVREGYERIDPVLDRARTSSDPFTWAAPPRAGTAPGEVRLFYAEAANHGIRAGYTVPIHDSHGHVASMTFAIPREAWPAAGTEQRERILQLVSMYFHAQVMRTAVLADGVPTPRLSRREGACIEWAARGKTAWEIGRILGISPRTAAFHLDNVKAKFGVSTRCEAVARWVALSGVLPRQ